MPFSYSPLCILLETVKTRILCQQYRGTKIEKLFMPTKIITDLFHNL